MMDFDSINKMLGEDIPNMLNTIKSWESTLDPFLAKTSELKSHMTPEQSQKIADLQQEIANAKRKINDFNL